MRVQLLGRLEVHEAERLVPLEGPRQRTLLALLALHSGMVVSTDRILAEVWGEDSPSHPANTIQAQISRLRALLGSKRIVTASGGYRLDVDREDVDVYRFEALVAAGRTAQRSGEPTAAAATLSEALALWRGPALADVLDMGFARSEAGRLDELRLIALESRIEADLAVGRHAEVIPELSALTEAHPLRERFCALLMTALYRAGRQAEALRVFRQTRAHLVDELAVDPGEELQRLEQRILIHDAGLLGPASSPAAPAAAPAARTTGNLRAPLTSFVGRRDLLDQVRQFIRSWRLVTLTGAGGTGKTRLALEAADAAGLALPDGVWVVELAPVSEPDRVAGAVLQALDVRSQPSTTMQAAPAPGTVRPAVERLRQYLRDKQLLLVLDNCEHLVETVAELAEALLRDCGRLRIVTTSREPLGVPGEMQLPVPPMRYPGPAEEDPEAIAGYEAVQLFEERARAVSPGFRLTEGNAVQAAEICRRLDGVPLAIELAAARTKTMSPTEITHDLADRFSLLTGGSRTVTARHRTLAAMVDWSYELLSPAERAVLDRLSVFSGGFTVDAAAAVCADLPETARRPCGTASTAWSTSPWSPPKWPRATRRVSRCWRRSGSTAPHGCMPPATTARYGASTPRTSSRSPRRAAGRSGGPNSPSGSPPCNARREISTPPWTGCSGGRRPSRRSGWRAHSPGTGGSVPSIRAAPGDSSPPWSWTAAKPRPRSMPSRSPGHPISRRTHTTSVPPCASAAGPWTSGPRPAAPTPISPLPRPFWRTR
ncbi:hypothetical protein Srufu_070000 [Streptomyces libani subsp. rufus]|nr:hypothetical protein Srufu_070000 [Streptomyces libani subsp. rufus]